MPSLDDIHKLEQLYATARSDVGKIVVGKDGPVYPESIITLMRYIQNSPWSDPDYRLDEAGQAVAKLSSASMNEIRTVLTAKARSERFCAGAWYEIMKGNLMASAIARAQEILNRSDQ